MNARLAAGPAALSWTDVYPLLPVLDLADGRREDGGYDAPPGDGRRP